MRKIEGEQVLMRIFIGESDKWERRPLHAALLDSQEHLEGVMPDVDRMMAGGLVTMEKVRVLRYAR